MKRQGIFLRSSPQFRKTEWVGESATGIPGITINNSLAYGTYLRNPDSGTGFLITRQNDSTSTYVASFLLSFMPFTYLTLIYIYIHRANIAFTVSLPTSKGTLTLPSTTGAIALNGRQSKLIITDYTFGASGALLYTTASIFFAGTIGARDVLFLYGAADQAHEFAFTPAGVSSSSSSRSSSPLVKFADSSAALGGASVVSVLQGVEGLITVWESDAQLVLYADATTAASFWAPPVRSQTANVVPGLEAFWQFGTNASVLVGGPYLVRNASLVSTDLDGGEGEGEGKTLALVGDLNASVPLTVFAPPEVVRVTWNGEPVGTMAQLGASGLRADLSLKRRVKGVRVPELTGWRYADSLPEMGRGYDDEGWVVADRTSTNIPTKPAFGDGRVLYGCDYGL